MHDQANELRQQFQSMHSQKTLRQPKIVALSGGSPKAGSTTVSVNVAVALAQQGRRIVLIDADQQAADATALCELDDTHGCLAEVVREGRSIHEALERGPAGVLVLPGSPGSGPESMSEAQTLIQQSRSLGLYADAVLIDLGSRTDAFARCLWQAAEIVGVITTPEVQAVMDTYATMKSLLSSDGSRMIHTIVNLAGDGQIAHQVHGRLTETSRRFLGASTRLMGHVPFDAELDRASVPAQSILLHSPRSVAARALDRLAETLWVMLMSSSMWFDQRGAASEDFAPAAGYGPLAA